MPGAQGPYLGWWEGVADVPAPYPHRYDWHNYSGWYKGGMVGWFPSTGPRGPSASHLASACRLPPHPRAGLAGVRKCCAEEAFCALRGYTGMSHYTWGPRSWGAGGCEWAGEQSPTSWSSGLLGEVPFQLLVVPHRSCGDSHRNLDKNLRLALPSLASGVKKSWV